MFVLGWSHGGSTVIGVVRTKAPGRQPGGPHFKSAVAFYSGCRLPLRPRPRPRVYQPTIPQLILHDEVDDLGSAAPCVEVADSLRASPRSVRAATYPGPHHGFDAPAGAVRVQSKVYKPAMAGEHCAHIGAHTAHPPAR